MDILDVAAVAKAALQLGLLTEEQIEEARHDIGKDSLSTELFLRACERKGYLTPWQSGRLLKGYTDGFFLGGYRILYKVASGSFGRVFRAEDPRTKRVVAIKVLRRRWSEDEQRIELFEREGKVGLSLRHSGIVEVVTVSYDPASRQYFIVMDFVEGGNLRDILAIRKRLEPAEALRLLEDAAAGLAHAHARGVSHRDVKLTNILISTQGSAKLVDFGLAKYFQSTDAKEQKIERTVDYAGLEKSTGVPTGDLRSDIYFLGCVFYEMLTGRPPLDPTRNKLARMARHRFDNVIPIDRNEVQGPASLFTLLDSMMALNPQHRFQTAAQLVEAIKAVRREIEGKNKPQSGGSAAKSVFVIEKEEKLQDALRERLKELGYRVFMAADPVRAMDRFRQQPFDALVMDVGTVGEDGLLMFERIMASFEKLGLAGAGIVILNEDQKEWENRVEARHNTRVLVRPVKIRQLTRLLRDLAPIEKAPVAGS